LPFARATAERERNGAHFWVQTCSEPYCPRLNRSKHSSGSAVSYPSRCSQLVKGFGFSTRIFCASDAVILPTWGVINRCRGLLIAGGSGQI